MFIVFYVNIDSILQLLLGQRLAAFHHQLFSWISVGPSKCSIDKMIGLQGHLAFWGVPRELCVHAKNSISKNILRMNKFLN